MQRKDFSFEIKDVSPAGIFSGYGSVYDVVDQGEDIVEAGCFTESLAECKSKGRMPAMLWQHDSSKPIGAYNVMKEDSTGLFVEGQLCLDTQLGAEAFALMNMKAISGMSIGFMTRQDSYDQKTGIRTIQKADLWECSIVTFPMNDDARISSVKSIEQITDFKSAEKYLRDSGSFSRSAATALIAHIKALAQRDSVTNQEIDAVANALNRKAKLLIS